MAQTATLTCNGDWQQIAEGPANVTMTAEQATVRYALRSESGDPAPGVIGHMLPEREDRSIAIETGTRVLIRGRSGFKVSVTVEAL